MAYNHYILTCGGTACESNKGAEIYEKLIEEAQKLGVKGEVQIVKTGCFGFCEKGPIIKVLPEDSFYVDVKPEDAHEIIAEQILKGREVKRLLYNEGQEKKPTNAVEDIQFYQKQFRVVLRNCGVINPESIDEYIARDGYSGMEKVLFEWTPEKIIEEMKISGLRGRGGAGFPTWLKWDLCRKAKGDTKFVICNADEGDPGAYMDRSTIEGDPHSVIEGMITAGKAIGSNQGFVYIRAEYPLASKGLKSPWIRRGNTALSGKTSLAPALTLILKYALARALLSAARKRRLSNPWKATGECPCQSRLSRRTRACGSCPRLSTTWKPLPMCR